MSPSPPSSASAFSITALSPGSVDAGSDGVTLTISGKGFADDLEFKSRVVWTSQGKATNLTVTATSTTQIIATAPAALLRNPDTVQIAVEKYDRTAGKVAAQSNPLNFTVGAGKPFISSISPSTATRGSPDLTLTVTGSDFFRGKYTSNVVWLTTTTTVPLATTYISGTKLTAVVPADLLQSPTSAQVQVQTTHLADSFPMAVSNTIVFEVTDSPWDY
jgi:hypothetical protein